MEEKNMSGGVEKKDYFLPASILFAGVMIAGSIIYLVQKNAPGGGPSDGNSPGDSAAGSPVDVAVVTDRDVILGNQNAPVTIIEYGDYQCPVCGLFFSDIEPLIREQYVNVGSVRMVYRNFAFLGPESVDAAEAAECAKDQKKFWAFHDDVYKKEIADGSEHNGNLNRDLFLAVANDAGLNVETFADCIDSKKYADIVKQETLDGGDAGVDATPTFFINNQKIRGLAPFEGSGGMKSIIDNALKASYN